MTNYAYMFNNMKLIYTRTLTNTRIYNISYLHLFNFKHLPPYFLSIYPMCYLYLNIYHFLTLSLSPFISFSSPFFTFIFLLSQPYILYEIPGTLPRILYHSNEIAVRQIYLILCSNCFPSTDYLRSDTIFSIYLLSLHFNILTYFIVNV